MTTGVNRTMFVGIHEHTIDGKGRLILPSEFRSRLDDGVFITRLDNCLAILPRDEFALMSDRLWTQVSEGLVNIDAMRSFAARAHETRPDSQGRLRILPHLRAAAGLDRRVIVTGAIRRVEVWAPDRWSQVMEVGTELLAEAITHGRGIADG